MLTQAVKINKNKGSCTVTQAKLVGQDNKLITSNLGDSGYLLVRPDGRGPEGTLKKLYRTVEQQHDFNFPFQVGTMGDNPNKAEDF